MQLLDITEEVQSALATTNGASAALIYVPHTTAGVTINEDADPALAEDIESAMERMVGDNGGRGALEAHWQEPEPGLAEDIESAMERIVDDNGGWRHSDADGPNAPSHIRASLISPQVLIPLDDGRLALGRWQGIFFCEFDGPRDRKVYITPLT